MNTENNYISLGFKSSPFSHFTSEKELHFIDDSFYKPHHYSTIFDGIKSSSVIVIGERGSGKTALSIDLRKKLNSKDSLIVNIDDYSELFKSFDDEIQEITDRKSILIEQQDKLKEGIGDEEIEDNEELSAIISQLQEEIEKIDDAKKIYFQNEILIFLRKKIADSFFLRAFSDSRSFWKLTKSERTKLSRYYHQDVGSSTKRELAKKIDQIQNNVFKRISVKIYNSSCALLNYGINAAISILMEPVTRVFPALPAIDNDREHLKKIEATVDSDFIPAEDKYDDLKDLCDLIKTSGYNNIYIFIDKIDEDARFDNDAEKISEFIKPIASNNKILTSEFFNLALFAWSTPFEFIKSSVRTQKITLRKLEWPIDYLKEVLKKRIISHSSTNQYIDIFENLTEKNKDNIFKLSNGNPRDLWHLLSIAFEEQFSIDAKSLLTDDAVEKAIVKFITDFNYYEYYPKKSKARKNSMDVNAYIKHLQKLKSIEFTKSHLNKNAQTGSSTTNYVTAMERMGLIKKTHKKSNGAVIYTVNDAKVSFAIENNITIF